MDEGYGMCTWKVLEQIWDKSKDINRDRYMLELFRMARNGMLCYAEGARVVNVHGPCEALELACRPHAPKVIDQCWRLSQAKPPAAPAAPTPRPEPPATPRGRGI
ncbi:uncharacterized protein LOC105442040 [Strongylocentrotus purpuratus]|uniref:Uncharacterized protein n=1 Tax=Strongylocentrotus purpuratus TaxID=7668 RepID=A0A7M7HFT4_STRPU|nr:uncharacterized protein LOC105442040 [Strongylocentrotus purpuratus]|eukprot:XP_011672091.1 PREDICTED: uncharacterized protein LOC105442040 [Strongylocentrotus purpuratus]